MSSFTASAINPRKRSRLAQHLCALGVSLATAALSTQAYAGCQYLIIDQWNEGFTAQIRITNDTAAPITGWNLSWHYTGNNRLTNNRWNAVYSGTNPYSASNLSWNAALQPNQTIEFGFQGSKSAGAAELPTLTGDVCGNGTGASSSLAPSSSPASSAPASSAAPSSVASSSVASSAAVSSAASSSVAAGPGVLFSDGFENATLGAAPAGWSTFIGWVFDGNNNSQASGNYALVDSSKSYTGGKSIRFRGGQNPAQIVRALPAGTQRLHMRAYVNMSKVLGNDPGDNHEHIMGIKKTPDANNEIRVGQIKGVLGTNHIPSDNIAPKMAQWNSGPQLAANTWYCVETAYYADTAYDELRMWVNGNLVHSITSANDWNNGALPADWLSDKFNYAMFGFHSFSGNTADVWMDDIVVSTNPIGCATTPISSSSSSIASSISSSVASSIIASSSSQAAVSSSSAASSLVTVSSSAANSSQASSAVSSAVANAAWDLDGNASYLNFATTKNTHNLEVHTFTNLSGSVSSSGVATVSIDLNSVNTGIAIRDQRMRDLLFETINFPAATITVAVPNGLLSALGEGQSTQAEISATVNLRGMSVPVTTRVSVQKLSNSRILVQSMAPVLTRAADYDLTAGVEALRSIANLTSISTAVPVDFALVFNAR